MATSIYPFTPFVYLIGWSRLNKWYIGSRSSVLENAHPSQLWISYFTSSDYVKRFAAEHGDPDVIMVRKTFTDGKTSRDYEDKVLRRLDVKGRDDFLNESNGWGDCHGDTTGMKWIRNHVDPEQATKQKQINHCDTIPEGWCYGSLPSNSGKRVIRNHLDPKHATEQKFIKPYEPVPEGWCYGGLSLSRGKVRIRNHHDPNKATKTKMINPDEPVPEGWYFGGMSKNKGKKSIRNHIDPKKATKELYIDSDESIPEGWYYGKRSTSEKARKQMSKSRKGLKWIRNHPDSEKATKQTRIKSNESIPEGWYYGAKGHSDKSRKRMSNSRKGSKWIRNHQDLNQATEHKMIQSNEDIPEGWYSGRMSVPEKSRKNMRGKKRSEKFKEMLKSQRATGVWIMCHGKFGSATDAAVNSPYTISASAISKWCRTENDRIITKKAVSKSQYLQEYFKDEDIIGKTFKEIGFGFKPLDKP